MVSLPARISELDRIIHEPARLAILTVLSACDEADFTFLLRITGLTNGNLSSHITKLESAGLVSIVKRFVGKKPQTLVSLTAIGRRQLDGHWRQLKGLRKQASSIAREQ